MDYLKRAKTDLASLDDFNEDNFARIGEALAQQITAYALIAICERLDRIIEIIFGRPQSDE